MDVEAVLDDGRQLDLKGVVVDGLSRVMSTCSVAGSAPARLPTAIERSHSAPTISCRCGTIAGVVVHRFVHRDDVLLRLLAQRAVVLVGDGVEQRADAGRVVVEPEVRGGEDRRALATALEEVGEDADQVARFLRVGGDQHLIFEQPQQMRRERPRLDEIACACDRARRRHSRAAGSTRRRALR